MSTNRLLIAQQAYMNRAAMYQYRYTNPSDPKRVEVIQPSNQFEHLDRQYAHQRMGPMPSPLLSGAGLAARRCDYGDYDGFRMQHAPPSHFRGAFKQEYSKLPHGVSNQLNWTNEAPVYTKDGNFVDNGSLMQKAFSPSDGRQFVEDSRAYAQVPNTAAGIQGSPPHHQHAFPSHYPAGPSSPQMPYGQQASEHDLKKASKHAHREKTGRAHSDHISKSKKKLSKQPKYVDDRSNFSFAPNGMQLCPFESFDPSEKIAHRKRKKNAINGCFVINIEPSIVSGPRIHDARMIDYSTHTQAYDQRADQRHYSINGTAAQPVQSDPARQAAGRAALGSAILQGVCNTVPLAIPAATGIGITYTAFNYLKSLLPAIGCLGVR